MKILCFGDSNTWGYNAKNGGKLPRPWTSVLQDLRKADEIIADGVCGRTTMGATPVISDSDGNQSFFKKYIERDVKLDVLIFMIGPNDFTVFFPERTAYDVAENIRGWIRAYREKPEGSDASFLVIAPANITGRFSKSPVFAPYYNEASVKKAALLPDALKKMSEEERILYLDANSVAAVSETDGLHLTPEGHQSLAVAVNKILP